MAKIKFINVEKSFGKNKVIKKFNLEINDGEFTVLVGPSGCGKSTLLRMISGLEKIDKGTILLNKNIINDLLPSKRDMAMVFQSYALYPHMNVYENMSFGLKMEKISKNNIQKKVNQAAKILKIKHLLDRKPGQLSGGQRQRVAIGRAISRNPKIFLFDEPLSNLDAALRSEMRVEISKLHKKIKTNMIYVTHDQVEAMTLADKMVILNEGRIEQVGSPDEIYNFPNNLFVAEFIGTPKMNIIKIDKSNIINNTTLRIFGKEYEFKNYKFRNEIYLGIRPEHIHPNLKHEIEFNINIDLIENLGSDKIIYGLFKDNEIRIRTSEDLSQNNTGFSFNKNKIVFFDSKKNKLNY
jgi:ABC-type sugar transport system ATPase subunit